MSKADTAAVIEANRVLSLKSPTVAELAEARQGVMDDLEELSSIPEIRPENALSVAEHDRLKGERENIILRKRVCNDLLVHLNERHARAHAEAAIATAEDDRQALEHALDAVDGVMRLLDASKAAAVDAAQVLAKKREHVGRGDRTVGATAEQMTRLMELHGVHADPEHQYRNRHLEGELKRLRLRCQIPQGT